MSEPVNLMPVAFFLKYFKLFYTLIIFTFSHCEADISPYIYIFFFYGSCQLFYQSKFMHETVTFFNDYKCQFLWSLPQHPMTPRVHLAMANRSLLHWDTAKPDNESWFSRSQALKVHSLQPILIQNLCKSQLHMTDNPKYLKEYELPTKLLKVLMKHVPACAPEITPRIILISFAHKETEFFIKIREQKYQDPIKGLSSRNMTVVLIRAESHHQNLCLQFTARSELEKNVSRELLPFFMLNSAPTPDVWAHLIPLP